MPLRSTGSPVGLSPWTVDCARGPLLCPRPRAVDDRDGWCPRAGRTDRVLCGGRATHCHLPTLNLFSPLLSLQHPSPSQTPTLRYDSFLGRCRGTHHRQRLSPDGTSDESCHDRASPRRLPLLDRPASSIWKATNNPRVSIRHPPVPLESTLHLPSPRVSRRRPVSFHPPPALMLPC